MSGIIFKSDKCVKCCSVTSFINTEKTGVHSPSLHIANYSFKLSGTARCKARDSSSLSLLCRTQLPVLSFKINLFFNIFLLFTRYIYSKVSSSTSNRHHMRHKTFTDKTKEVYTFLNRLNKIL